MQQISMLKEQTSQLLGLKGFATLGGNAVLEVPRGETVQY